MQAGRERTHVDAWQRYRFNAKTGMVEYVKDQVAIPLDKPIAVGKPMDDKWLRAHNRQCSVRTKWT